MRSTGHRVIVHEAQSGKFEARLGGRPDARVLCTSRQPFLDAAILLAEGCDPDAMLVTRHAGKTGDALTARLGTAAARDSSSIARRMPQDRRR
jgi:hypothetical protein